MNRNSKTYDHLRTLEYNIKYGPFWNKQLPDFYKSSKTATFLGQQLNTPFGIPACPLTVNAKYVELHARLGFDILTFKSVRTVKWNAHKHPNWMYVDITKPLESIQTNKYVIASYTSFEQEAISTANSFGISSAEPNVWIKEYNDAASKINPGQILILSLMITPGAKQGILADAIELAKLAKQTSATIVEINLSCPNTFENGLLYEDTDLSSQICKEMKKILGGIHLIAKIGLYTNPADIKLFLKRTANYISGIATTNTLALEIRDINGKHIFGQKRKMAGVSGIALLKLALEQAATTVKYKNLLGMDYLKVIGIGGVTKPEDAIKYFQAGVDIVQAATGSWHNPYLAVELKKVLA